MDGDIRIGTSGFTYKDWLGNFYPQFLMLADFLRFYASKFDTVEVDSTFYHIPAEKTVDKWAGTVPDGFLFAAKFPRTVTHEGQLESRIENAAYFIQTMRRLGDKLGPLVMQFAASFRPDSRRLLLGLIESLPVDGKFAVELRHPGWLKEEAVLKALERRNIALCHIDFPGWPITDLSTADFAYLRFLGDRTEIESDFSWVRLDRQKELGQWAELIRQFSFSGKKIYGYFNNHYSGHAPTTANLLAELLQDG
jgi:uncharacterized protein YecE (DUF72 family)